MAEGYGSIFGRRDGVTGWHPASGPGKFPVVRSESLLSEGKILDCLNDGVYVCDRDRRIIYWNRSAHRILGWQSEEVVGRRCRDELLCHVDKDGHQLCGHEHCPLHRAMETGSGTREPLIIYARTKDGRRVPTRVTAAPIQNIAGEVIGAVETFRDVSEMLVELERAAKILSQSLETDLPDDPRLRFSTLLIPYGLVGGDYYSIQKLDEDRYAFVIADLEGHGVAAALYTMKLDILWNKHCRALESPKQIASAINRKLVRIFESDVSFATAVFGVINARDGALTLSGAGGPRPLVGRSNGRIDTLCCTGLPLGLAAEALYEEHTAQLEPGDSLLLFTDGAFEIHNSKSEMLDVDGLAQILQELDYPRTPIKLGILEEKLLRFSNNIRLPDDLTIIEMRFAGQAFSRTL